VAVKKSCLLAVGKLSGPADASAGVRSKSTHAGPELVLAVAVGETLAPSEGGENELARQVRRERGEFAGGAGGNLAGACAVGGASSAARDAVVSWAGRVDADFIVESNEGSVAAKACRSGAGASPANRKSYRSQGGLLAITGLSPVPLLDSSNRTPCNRRSPSQSCRHVIERQCAEPHQCQPTLPPL
jgi:hypothetical protein